MKINREPIKLCETYILNQNDTFKIEKNGITTNIVINNKEIKFVTKIELLQEKIDYVEIKIERLCIKQNFEEV